MKLLLNVKHIAMNYVFQKESHSEYPIYCRTVTSESNTLCKLYTKVYNKKTQIVPSGISSINVALNVALKDCLPNKPNLIISNELFSGSFIVIDFLAEIYQFNKYIIDVSNEEEITQLFETLKDQHNILFIESCSNPTGKLFNFKLANSLRRSSKKFTCIVDNTWLTHVVFDGVKYEIDIIVSSLTKYYTSGRCIGGFICATKYYNNKIRTFIRANGLHTTPIYCNIAIEEFNHMENRIKRSSKITQQIAHHLETNLKLQVFHPSLASNKSNQYASSIFKNKLYPSVLCFILNKSMSETYVWMKGTGITIETSFGSSYSKFCNWAKKIDDDHTMIRLSIGYDDTIDNLINKICL